MPAAGTKATSFASRRLSRRRPERAPLPLFLHELGSRDSTESACSSFQAEDRNGLHRPELEEAALRARAQGVEELPPSLVSLGQAATELAGFHGHSCRRCACKRAGGMQAQPSRPSELAGLGLDWAVSRHGRLGDHGQHRFRSASPRDGTGGARPEFACACRLLSRSGLDFGLLGTQAQGSALDVELRSSAKEEQQL